MPIESRSTIKSHFENGDAPTQTDFWNWIDSFIHIQEEGITPFRAPDGSMLLGFGITQQMNARLNVKAFGGSERVIAFHRASGAPVFGFSLLPTSSTPGFSIQRATAAGSVSSFFIDEATGEIGMGTLAPERLLHLSAASPSDITALKMQNVSALHPGWAIGHVHNGSIPEKDGAFVVYSEPTAAPGSMPTERLTILPAGYIGINAFTPETYLHVSADPAEPSTYISLLPNTGIAQFGPVTNSVLLDHQGIQKRVAVDTGGGVYDFDPGTLHLQRLGGDIEIHNNVGTPEEQQVVIRSNGRVGIGKSAPDAALHVNGWAVFGDEAAGTPVEGAVRWNGSDLEVFDGTLWVSLTGGAGYWTAAGVDKITYNATDASVGIGVTEPNAALDVATNSEATANSLGVNIVNSATSTGASADDIRFGLRTGTTGTWSALPNAKNIALAARALGQANANANMAAVLDGNVVIGSIIAGEDMVGDSGQKILVIQNGTAPDSTVGPVGATDRGVQLYSSNVDGASCLHMVTGAGHLIKLYRNAALSAASTQTVDATYGAEEADVISKLVIRVAELEARLRDFGLLEPVA